MEQSIAQLVSEWMSIICGDHHKDKDCHWYITTIYSYGNPPYYQASHNGYLIDDWYGLERKSYKEAEQDLFFKLKEVIKYEKEIRESNGD